MMKGMWLLYIKLFAIMFGFMYLMQFAIYYLEIHHFSLYSIVTLSFYLSMIGYVIWKKFLWKGDIRD